MSDEIFQAEKDSLIFLGLMSRAFSLFDPSIEVVGESAPTHFRGLNIHACVIDNPDGELLAIEQNSIHGDQDPLKHAEQKSLRQAISRLGLKRPRSPSITVEQYYRSQLFMDKGTALTDFLRKGATCYTTLEPCPMCASTLLVARMKRVVYVLPDSKYGGAWNDLKNKYYAPDEEVFSILNLNPNVSRFTHDCAELHKNLMSRADSLRSSGVRDTHILDRCREELEQASEMLRSLKSTDLVTTGTDLERNLKMSQHLKQACNLPVR